MPVAGAAMLAAILESAVGAIVVIDEGGIIQMANPATTALFGYGAGELVGQNVSVLMPEPDRGRHDRYLADHLRTGVRKIIGIGRNVAGRRKDGSTFPLHLAVSAFAVKGRRYFAGVMHDLSEQIRMQTQIDQQGSIFEAVFNGVPEALIICDGAGAVTLCNDAAAATFGHAPVDLVGTRLAALYDETEGRDIARGLAGAARGEQSGPIQAPFRRKGGATFPGEIVLGPISDRADGRAGALCLIRDITQQREQEKALRQAQRLEAFGQLTGGVAHDFNNLLTVISGYQELLQRRLGDDKDLALLKRAQDAAGMGARLTSRLLLFARRGHFDIGPLDLNEQVLVTADLLRRTLGEHIDLTTLLAPRLWIVRADASEVENGIVNLALNARDAMPIGGALIIETSNVTIPAEGVPPRDLMAGDYVRLSVTDTGTGMAPEVLERALEPFFTTKPPGQGTGLGLSGVYGFARQLGGTVTVASSVGRGTTVDVYLPRAADETAGAVPADVGDSLPYSAGETVLLVEDDADVRHITRDRLDTLGYRVLEADGGPRAIELLASGHPVDLVLSDVVMAGGQSGFDVARWVRANRPAVGVLLMSGYPDDVLRQAGTVDPGLRILRKPFGLAALAQALRRVLDA